MTKYDLVETVAAHPGLHTPDFWPPLLYRLNGSSTPIPLMGLADLRERHTCESGSSPSVESTLTIEWDAVALRSHRSDCMDASNATHKAHNDNSITEDAAIGAMFCALPALCPGNRVTRVSEIGTRADYYLNGRSDEMIEVGGSNDPAKTIDSVDKAKSAQILSGSAHEAWVSVVNFSSKELRLRKVR